MPSFESVWAIARQGQILTHGDFCIVRSRFMAVDMYLAIIAGMPMYEGWQLSKSGVRVNATYEAMM